MISAGNEAAARLGQGLEFVADLFGVGVLRVLENGLGLFPGVTGGVVIAGGVVRVAETGEGNGFLQCQGLLAVGDASVLLRRADLQRAAVAQGRKAAGLLERCEGASTPPVRSMAARARLTTGELQTALQASAGHSDKQIARARTLSVRTIQSQLYRAYDKLGITGWHELTEALKDRSSPT